ncbi:MAG: hypothetical protein EZS28_014053 [Streblomastix strix]|uniref:RING-type domain-containing protein n=1 Tax=Streblomastix strix TaxID=222440 RepID=A0A5J4W645_9EUKA|nr:MAG: hypothetical protein EZS28_014053 [Streblomastix strix]
MNYNNYKIQLQEVQNILPGIDIDLIMGLLMKYEGDEDYLNIIFDEVSKQYKGQYPKEKDKAIKPIVPEKDFSKYDTRVSANYTNNARNFLFNNYRFVPDGLLNKVLSKHNNHLTPSINFLKSNLSRNPGIFVISELDGEGKETIVDALENPRPLIPTSSDLHDAQFEEEIAVVKRKQKEQKIERNKSQIRSKEAYDAEASGKGLIECSSCYSMKFEKETVACTAGHRACITCVVESIQSGLTSARPNSSCIGDVDRNCQEHYSDLVLQKILDKVDYDRFTAYELEISLGQLKDDRLLRCNFCGYREYMPDDDENFKFKDLLTFKCKNPKCMIITCRKCDKPYHLPVLCPQMKAEKGIGALNLACQVAAESILIRHCPQCGLPTCKVGPCNYITCRCGCHWCYSCEQSFPAPRDVYAHFRMFPTICPMNEDSRTEDKRRIRKAVEKAVADWKAQNPDMAHLTIDIEQYIPK